MRKDNRILFLVIVAYIIFLLVQQAYFLVNLNTLSSDITARASGEVSICNNKPPNVNYTCPLQTDQNDEYYCEVQFTDADGDSATFDIDFLPPPDIFNITVDGVINFTPNQSYVGNHTFRISIWDDSQCSNNVNHEDYNFTINDVNDPPILIQNIPNQTWNQDTSLTAFDLDNYFWDPDGDPLNYTNTFPTDITVSIDNNSVVTFTPSSGFYGTRTVVFFAWDPYNANASSNTVTLTVIQTSSPAQPTSGGSSGGGGGGAPFPNCIPSWYCRPWGPCEPDGFRYRECYDLNNCSSDFGKPNTTEACDFISTCHDGFIGPDEEGVDCGGPCPPCGTCYDNTCNNNEDCTLGMTETPDCGGPCQACVYESNETCYDNVCNNNEDCVYGLTDIPDCGGPCDECPELEQPALTEPFNWFLLVILTLLLITLGYTFKKAYPYLKIAMAKKRRKTYEERLMLETEISESIYDSLSKLESLLDSEDIEKLILLFSTIVRRYFKSLFNLDYEFTYEELMFEIKSRNISETFKNVLKAFFDRSLEVEFSGKSVSREELKAMISEFKQILSATSEQPFVKGKTPETKTKLSEVDSIYAKITAAEDSLRKGDINDAYFKYLRIVHDYNALSGPEKNRIYSFITRLFEEIKLAREKYELEHSTKQ